MTLKMLKKGIDKILELHPEDGELNIVLLSTKYEPIPINSISYPAVILENTGDPTFHAHIGLTETIFASYVVPKII